MGNHAALLIDRLSLTMFGRRKVSVGGVSGCGERVNRSFSHSPVRGPKETCKFPIWSLAMFKVPAYDPIAIAIMCFGILIVVALAFTF